MLMLLLYVCKNDCPGVLLPALLLVLCFSFLNIFIRGQFFLKNLDQWNINAGFLVLV